MDLVVKAGADAVFGAVSTPRGLDTWWTKSSSGSPTPGNRFELDFGPGYLWRAVVSACEAPTRFELEMVEADADWLRTRVRFELAPGERGITRLHFSHVGWPEPNEHWRVSCYCWAAYLRLLRRNLEFGEFVPYEKRLEA